MSATVFQNQQTQEVIKYIHDQYGDELEFLWQKFPENAIWRNKTNQKWYALLLIIPKSQLGFKSSEKVEILDLRFHKNEALDFAASNAGVYPGYHMNKNNWITIILDGSIETSRIIDLIDNSYNISLQK